MKNLLLLLLFISSFAHAGVTDKEVNSVQSGTWNINNISGTLSLPSGAATSALQTTGNTSLSSLVTNFDVLLSSRATESTLSAMSAKLPATLGQKTMANSMAIVIASDQSAIPVTQSGTWNINNISGTISLPTGAATSANQTTQTTALQLIDNLPHANNVALSNGAPVMGQLDDTATGAVTENNVSTARITALRGLHVNLRDNAGTEIGTTTTPIVSQGNVASAATDSGNPIKVGGRYNSTTPAFTNGQRGDLQIDPAGNLLISQRNSFTRIVTATTTTVKSGAGFLHSLCYNSSVNGTTITVYDNTTATAPIIAIIATPNGHQPNCMQYDIRFSTGLTIVTSSTEDITVSWQ